MAKRQKKLPAMPTYGGDWFKHTKLGRCGLAARGLYFEIRLLMWEESERRGVLGTPSDPWEDDDIISQIRGKQDVTRRCLDELIKRGVLLRSKRTGRLWSLDEVQQERIRKKRERAGGVGGRKSAQARGQAKPQSPPQAISETEIETDLVSSSVRIPGESEGDARAGPSSADYPLARMFDTFRAKYPRARVGGLVAARTAFVQAAHVGAGFWRCSALEAAERLCVLAEEYAASPRVKGRAMAHVPYAVNWLEKGEWQDAEQWLVDESSGPRTERTASDYARGAR